jgi:DNA modification methylase
MKQKITTLWDFKKCDERFGFKYPGRIPGQIIWNLMYYYTEEGDVFLDPMAGSGTSIDVGKMLGRKVIAFDLKPSRNDIIQNDITKGIPLRDNSVDFVFLDPPYWNMKKGEYTNRKDDLSRMSLGDFYEQIDFISRESFRVLKQGGHVALIISTKNNKIDGFVDLGFECYRILKRYFKPVERMSVPYHGVSSHTEEWKERCIKYKFMLRGFRDLMVFQKAI